MAEPIAYQLQSRTKLPPSLIAVAWIFIAFGILAAIDILWAALNQRLSLNFGVLYLFIGFGLLRLKSQARIWALVFLWFELIIFALLCVLVIVSPSGWYFTFNGVRTTITSWKGTVLAVGILLGFTGFTVWQIVVLMRPGVRALFTSAQNAPRGPQLAQ